jgi:hypothetical protein
MRLLFIFALAGALMSFPGCIQNPGSGSSGDAYRSDPANSTVNPGNGVRSNEERGDPPGSSSGGLGPARGVPGAGSNRGVIENFTSTAAPASNSNQNGPSR